MSEEDFSLDLGDSDNNEDDNFSLVIAEDPPDDKAENEARFRQLELDNAALRAQQNTRFEHQYVAPAPAVQHQNFDRRSKAEIDAEIAANMALNPADFLRANNQQLVNAAQDEMNRRFKPIQIATVKQAIHGYASQNIKDPEVRKEFDKIIKTYTEDQLANFDVTKIDETLAYTHKFAKVEALERGHVPEEHRRSIPNYGGSRSGGAPAGHKRLTQEDLKLTPAEKEYVKIQRSLGQSDNESYKDIQNERRNPNKQITVSHREG